MFELRTLLILIPALPLLAAIATAVLGPRLLRSTSHRLTVLALGSSFLCSLGVVGAVISRAGDTAARRGEMSVGYEHVERLWTWVEIPQAMTMPDGRVVPFDIDVTLRADGLSAMMLAMVTFVATLVAIYSIGYMHGDRGYWRFFSYVSLFVFSMTMLVLVSNFLLLFVFWEAVGVCSYLLIGFWYEKELAAAAGKKAFLVNRIGDMGFMLALMLLWTTYGSLNFHDTSTAAGVLGQQRLSGQLAFAGGGIATAICLLLLLGACGKSAQLPLHVWLPDAMEGPTSVSALIHAATMVTAGVYLVARCSPLFAASPTSQVVVATVGCLTALLAGLIALTQFDLKRVLAYSTISQLGFMFLALGTGAIGGITAAMFHLFTHAFFKALLFLGAGSVMHAMGNVIDIRRFGGLRRMMPWTHRTFLVGCLALAGVFPFAGFWSKDQIVASVQLRARGDHGHAAAATRAAGTEHAGDPAAAAAGGEMGGSRAFQWLFYGSLLSAFLTAFYTFRAYFLTFFGPEQVPEEAGHHAHESPMPMVAPLMVLAVCAFGVGFVFESGHRFASFIATAPSLAYLVPAGGFHGSQFHWDVAVISTIVALSGIALSAFLYLGHLNEVDVLARRFWPLHRLSYSKFFFDEVYQWCVVWPLQGLAQLSDWLDRWLVDGLVNLIGRVPLWFGSATRGLQRGLVPFYGLMMAIGAVVVLGLGGLWWLGG